MDPVKTIIVKRLSVMYSSGGYEEKSVVQLETSYAELLTRSTQSYSLDTDLNNTPRQLDY